METTTTNKTNFIWEAVEQDLESGRYQNVHTRFPPEPNGYLHIGHCKAMFADFQTAERFGGVTNLRFDDTNPAKEETEYVDGIMEPQDSIKGQAYMAMTITAGNVMSSLFGGWLIDAAGVGAMLICASLAAFIGWLIVCLGSKEAKTA